MLDMSAADTRLGQIYDPLISSPNNWSKIKGQTNSYIIWSIKTKGDVVFLLNQKGICS